MHRGHKFAAVILLAVMGAMGAVADPELDVSPGWTDGFFDGSDHTTSGINVYIQEPDWGSIPMPSGPVPVDESEYSEKTTPDLGDLLETPDPNATETAAAASARYLAIRYDDSSVQVVPLRHPFRRVARIRTIPEGPTRRVGVGFQGRWNGREFGRITITRTGDAWTGTSARRGLRFEGTVRTNGAMEGTWCDSTRRSGRALLVLSTDGQSLTMTRFQGLDREIGTITARR